jgi:hypothetical protein
MGETIKDGTGRGYQAKVDSTSRIWTNAIAEPIGSERSLGGFLYGTGTRGVTLSASANNDPVLWLRNDDPENYFQIDKLIYGWNGGSTNYNRTCLCLISYQMTEPTGNITAATPTIENIAKSGTSQGVTDSKATAWKWDGVGDGMTGQTGGYVQIVNRIGQGDTSLIGIAGQIVLGQNDAMSLGVIPEEAGLFNAAIVYWKIPVMGRS